MSTSLLYHSFGIRGYQYLNTQYKGGEILFKIEQGKHDLRSHCGSQNVIRRGTLIRRFRAVSIGTKDVWMISATQRVWCAACQQAYQDILGHENRVKKEPGGCVKLWIDFMN